MGFWGALNPASGDSKRWRVPYVLWLYPLVPPVFVARCRFLFLFSTHGVFHSLCRAVGVRLSGRPRGVWSRFRGFSPGVVLFLVLLFSGWWARVLRLAPTVVSFEVCGSHSPFWLRGLPCLFGRGQFWKRWLTSTLKRPVEMP